MANFFPYLLLFCAVTVTSCAKAQTNANAAAPEPSIMIETEKTAATPEPANKVKTREALRQAKIPSAMAEPILASFGDNPAFLLDLLAALGGSDGGASGDPMLYTLVDKTHALPEGYTPEDLVELSGKGKSYTVSRKGLFLRKEAEEALETMARAAKADGVTLQASSTYRSYDYQVTVYNRNVKEMGQEAADRESARPGYSQHQTGLVVDFGSISDEFAGTEAGRWMLSNANRYGWSLSFPQGYEEITGYRWESWHYRYVGQPLEHFIQTWFGNIQQYALQFIYYWLQEK